ncbi:MAG: hypothetical protein IH621_01930 [Krumholzibacteria bacterium]|nr:hypothetical protein [Candidatus Krumholzibacteria bacterium]
MRYFISLLLVAFMAVHSLGWASQSKPANTANPPPTAGAMPNLTEALESLAEQMVTGMEGQRKSMVAVTEFTDSSNRVSDLGVFLAEEMITRLFRTGRLRVVERSKLNEVLAEHNLGMSGLVDDATVKQLGKILGVDAVAVGSIIDLGDQVRVNARLISAETGSVFSVAAVSLPKDEQVSSMMRRIPRRPSSTVAGGGSSLGSVGGYNYFEDFSSVEEGQFPEGWSGGATLYVKPSTQLPGKNVLAPFQGKNHEFSIPELVFPENWKLEIQYIIDHGGSRGVRGAKFRWRAGSLDFGYTLQKSVNTWSQTWYIGNTNIKTTTYLHKICTLALEKQGDVFKLYLNSDKLLVTRNPGFTAPKGLAFSYPATFGIYSIKLTELP